MDACWVKGQGAAGQGAKVPGNRGVAVGQVQNGQPGIIDTLVVARCSPAALATGGGLGPSTQR